MESIKKSKKDELVNYSIRKTFGFCDFEDLKVFLEFRNMPLGGGFVEKKYLTKKKTYQLTVTFCRRCKETQILETISPGTLFKGCPGCAVFFVYNCCDEVMEKVKGFIERGVRVIFQLSEPKIIEP